MKILKSVAKRTNLSIVLIPYRYDKEGLNQAIYKTNIFFCQFAARNNINIIDTSVIERSSFTRHGLHLNVSGKKIFVDLIFKNLNRKSRSFSFLGFRPGKISRTR